MGKFSVIEILDDRQNYIIGLSVFIQSCSEKSFTGAYQVSGTTKGNIVLDDLAEWPSSTKDNVSYEQFLIVLGYPEDFQVAEFERQLVPYIKEGISVLVIVESGYEKIIKQFPNRVKRLPLQEVFEPALDWSKKMGEILTGF